MQKQVTFGHILTILAMIIIPLFLWGVNVERRFEQTIDNTKSISEIKEDVNDLEEKDDEIIRIIQKNQIEVINEFSDVKVLIANKQ
ncbi:MAG: hypothetical protein QQN55_01010 [Nitrosopumilus sp.]